MLNFLFCFHSVMKSLFFSFFPYSREKTIVLMIFIPPLRCTVAPDMKCMRTWNWDIHWFFSVSCVQGFFYYYGGHSAPTWCNLITVDLGMPKQCPCRAVQNASREHPVLGDRNIRRDRWLINHGGACTVSMGGLPLESTLWAGGQREHQLSNMIPGCIATLTG